MCEVEVNMRTFPLPPFLRAERIITKGQRSVVFSKLQMNSFVGNTKPLQQKSNIKQKLFFLIRVGSMAAGIKFQSLAKDYGSVKWDLILGDGNKKVKNDSNLCCCVRQ